MLDKLWDAPSVIAAFAGRGIEVDPAHLGAMTVSMLEGVHGHQRKEVEKLVAWLKTEPAPDVVTLPYTLLIALAKPLREAIGRPVVCTLQGEELFLEGLPEPWRTRSLDLIRAQVDEVDGFIAVSRYCAGFMRNYLKIPDSKLFTVPLGINLDGHGLEGRQRNETLPSATSRASRRRRGCTCWPTATGRCANAPAFRQRGWRQRATSRRRIGSISRRWKRSCGSGDWRISSTIAASSIVNRSSRS